MVEKIDRPEAPQTYTISQAKETKEDRHQQHNPKDDAERERKKQIEGKQWQKFGRRTVVIKPLRVDRAKIKRLLFRGAGLHSGIGTLRADVIWADGKKTSGVLMLIRRLEDYLKLKGYAPGQEIPEELWVRGPTVEMGIPQTITEAGALSGRDMEGGQRPAAEARASKSGWALKAGLKDPKTGKTNWGLVLMYAFVLALALAAVAAVIAQFS